MTRSPCVLPALSFDAKSQSKKVPTKVRKGPPLTCKCYEELTRQKPILERSNRVDVWSEETRFSIGTVPYHLKPAERLRKCHFILQQLTKAYFILTTPSCALLQTICSRCGIVVEGTCHATVNFRILPAAGLRLPLPDELLFAPRDSFCAEISRQYD